MRVAIDVFVLERNWEGILFALRDVGSIDLTFHDTGVGRRIPFDVTVDWALRGLSAGWTEAHGVWTGTPITHRQIVFYGQGGERRITLSQNPDSFPEVLDRLFFLYERTVCEVVTGQEDRSGELEGMVKEIPPKPLSLWREESLGGAFVRKRVEGPRLHR